MTPLIDAWRGRTGGGALLQSEAGAVSHDEARRVIARQSAAIAAAVDVDVVVAIVPQVRAGDLLLALSVLAAGRSLALLHPRWTAAQRDARLAALAPVVVMDAACSITQRVDGQRADYPGGRPAALMFTSGTSGPAKAACLSGDALTAAVRMSRARIPFGPGDRWHLAMPPAHIGGLSVLLRAVEAGGAVSLGMSGGFHADGFTDELARAGATHVSLVPTMLSRWMRAGASAPSMLACVLVGGAASPPALIRRARAAGIPTRTTYGMTEACSQVATSGLGDPPGCVGEPLPGAEVRVGADGGLAVRGPNLFDGYLGHAARGAEAWFETGDQARRDGEGRLYILGRRDDVIVSGGENVHPLEVERALLEREEIGAALVHGRADEDWGERVVAVIVPRAEASEDDVRRAIEAANESLAAFQRVRAFRCADVLPLNANGKTDRRAARAGAARFVPIG